MSWYNPWSVLASVRRLMWDSDRQEREEVSSVSVGDDATSAVNSESQDSNPDSTRTHEDR